MTFVLDRYHGFPAVATAAIRARTAVCFAAGGVERGVREVVAGDTDALGVVHAGAAIGDGVTVHERSSVERVTASAAVDTGDPVAMGADGRYAPAAAGALAVGDAVTPADAADEVFSVYVNPRVV